MRAVRFQRTYSICSKKQLFSFSTSSGCSRQDRCTLAKYEVFAFISRCVRGLSCPAKLSTTRLRRRLRVLRHVCRQHALFLFTLTQATVCSRTRRSVGVVWTTRMRSCVRRVLVCVCVCVCVCVRRVYACVCASCICVYVCVCVHRVCMCVAGSEKVTLCSYVQHCY